MQARQYGIFDTPVQCGLDIHKIPWYGEEKDIHVLGMERVRGTNFGHAYASVECVNTRERFTASVLRLHQFTTKEQLIASLLSEAENYVKISRLFLDREFFDVQSITALQRSPVQFVIPAEHNNAIKECIISAHYQRVLIPRAESCAFITPYTMKKGKQHVIITLVVTLEPPRKIGDKWDEFSYVTNIPVTLESAVKIADSYRNLWEIETGYRVKEDICGKTCLPQYLVRLLFQLLSVFLYNL
ncbi:MAG: hypothetical protein BV458_12400 [Thermoplasmata archaeon M9B2D]|nr:MAG: hypothetical protein BV458_12400 [Thermoplasmata archaeon M9B2D]